MRERQERGKTVRDDRKRGKREGRERHERAAREVREVRKSNIMESWKCTFCFVVTVLFLILPFFKTKY